MEELLQRFLKIKKIPFRIFICSFWDSGKILKNLRDQTSFPVPGPQVMSRPFAVSYRVE